MTLSEFGRILHFVGRLETANQEMEIGIYSICEFSRSFLKHVLKSSIKIHLTLNWEQQSQRVSRFVCIVGVPRAVSHTSSGTLVTARAGALCT